MKQTLKIGGGEGWVDRSISDDRSPEEEKKRKELKEKEEKREKNQIIFQVTHL